ncbi:MAG: GntR family transcriptional regulator, partial [Novosphingobium sp.]|nr:GntR family transcriptional regulator [Novosphingobium sp.]
SQIVVHRTAEQYSRADMQQSQRDHRDLVGAFAMRDEAWASAIANTHIRRAANAYRTNVDRESSAAE